MVGKLYNNYEGIMNISLNEEKSLLSLNYGNKNQNFEIIKILKNNVEFVFQFQFIKN